MISKLFKDAQRIDGRNLDEYRNIRIRFPKNDKPINDGGTCLVSFGDTSVVAKVSCSVVEPKSTYPSRGLINLKIETSSLKNTSNKLRPSTDETLKLEPILKDLLRDSIDMDSLCICAGESVFCVNINIKATSDDGNLLDVIVLAATVALATFKRPDVSIGEAGNFIVHTDMREKDPVPLKLKQLPFLITIGVAVESNLMILDLNKVEEETLDSRLVVAMTPTGDICCMHPLGSKLWTYDDFLDRCIDLAMKKVVGLQCLVQQAVLAAQSTQDTIVINSVSFLGPHPIFADNAAVEVEETRPIFAAPEAIGDDMDIESDEYDMEADNDVIEVRTDDWSRIESLMAHTTSK